MSYLDGYNFICETMTLATKEEILQKTWERWLNIDGNPFIKDKPSWEEYQKQTTQRLKSIPKKEDDKSVDDILAKAERIKKRDLG